MTQTPKFKQTFVDFIVEEHLPYPLAQRGTRYYVQLEKRNMNTMDMVKQIMKTFSLTRKKIGIAGLKDKHALAKQRVCFHGNDVKKIGEKLFLNGLNTIARVMTTGCSELPLGLHSQITNEFRIRLKYDTSVGADRKAELEKRFNHLMKDGFPNYFGEQRFGVTMSNHRIAQDILEGGRKHFSQGEKMFKLQGYSSRLFNKYLEHRLKVYNELTLLDGDLLIDSDATNGFLLYSEPNIYHTIGARKDKGFFVEATPAQKIEHTPVSLNQISGPLIGYNTLMNPATTEAGKYEGGRRKHFNLTEEHLHLYKPYKLFGLRRALRVTPTDADYKWQGNDLLLHFTLPKSAYASVVVDLLVEEQKVN